MAAETWAEKWTERWAPFVETNKNVVKVISHRHLDATNEIFHLKTKDGFEIRHYTGKKFKVVGGKGLKATESSDLYMATRDELVAKYGGKKSAGDKKSTPAAKKKSATKKKAAATKKPAAKKKTAATKKPAAKKKTATKKKATPKKKPAGKKKAAAGKKKSKKGDVDPFFM